jgi:hypothetical protein
MPRKKNFPKPGDLVTMRTRKNEAASTPIFKRVSRPHTKDDEGLYSAIGRAYLGDVYIFLEASADPRWKDSWLILDTVSGIKGLVEGTHFKKVR